MSTPSFFFWMYKLRAFLNASSLPVKSGDDGVGGAVVVGCGVCSLFVGAFTCLPVANKNNRAKRIIKPTSDIKISSFLFTTLLYYFCKLCRLAN